MFSLIISIIAIALVAALALASIYYGGTAFQQGSADAEASTIVNQGQQIQAAFTMSDIAEYDLADTSAHATADTLPDRLVTGGFLKEVPSIRGAAWEGDDVDSDATYISVTVETEEICDAVEEKFNPSFNGTHSALGANSFGCDSSLNAYYKL